MTLMSYDDMTVMTDEVMSFTNKYKFINILFFLIFFSHEL